MLTLNSSNIILSFIQSLTEINLKNYIMKIEFKKKPLNIIQNTIVVRRLSNKNIRLIFLTSVSIG